MSYCLISKNPVNTLLFTIYFSFLDIKQTVSTVFPLSHKSSVTSPPSLNLSLIHISNSQKLNCISVSHPVLNNKSWIIIISVFCNICQRNIFIFKIFRVNSNINSFCVNNFPNYFICLLYTSILFVCFQYL